MELDKYKVGRMEVVKTRRSGFGEQCLFSRLRDGVDYIAGDLVKYKEEKSSYCLKVLNRDSYRPLMIRYEDYKKGKEYADFYGLIYEKVLRWVQLNEAFIESVRKIEY